MTLPITTPPPSNLCTLYSFSTHPLDPILVGHSEMLNVVNPDIITGGEAIARMLSSNTTLRTLDLSWNAIRLSSAEDVARVVSVNSCLVTLNLAHNTFGDMPAQLMGRSLKFNRSLRHLDLSFTGIVPRSATVLANALCHNESMTYLNMDGNILGDIGCR